MDLFRRAKHTYSFCGFCFVAPLPPFILYKHPDVRSSPPNTPTQKNTKNVRQLASPELRHSAAASHSTTTTTCLPGRRVLGVACASCGDRRASPFPFGWAAAAAAAAAAGLAALPAAMRKANSEASSRLSSSMWLYCSQMFQFSALSI